MKHIRPKYFNWYLPLPFIYNKYISCKAKKSLRFLVIGRVRNRCGDMLLLFFCFFCQQGNTWYIVYAGTKFPIQKYGSCPYVKKSFKTQHGRILVDPAILAAIGHRFIAQENLKCLRTRRPKTFVFFGLKLWWLPIVNGSFIITSNKIDLKKYISQETKILTK